MSKHIESKTTQFALAAFLCTSISGASLAQETGFSLEEIVVTARKVEESLQDVPLSISAFTSDDIKARGIGELEDLALLTPGFSYEDFSNGAYGTPIIRGATQFSVGQLEQNVSTFIDGVYIPRQYAIDTGTLGLERIEVVKGPQSALYGANAFAGAINYVTTQADLEELNGNLSVVLGSDERRDVSGEISVPLVPGVVAVRLAASTTEFDGDWVNTHPEANSGPSPGTEGKLGGWDNDSFTIGVVAEPTDALSIEASYNKFDVFTETRPQSRLARDAGDLNCSFTNNPAIFSFVPVNTAYCGELPTTPLEPGTTNPTGFIFDPRGYGVDSETEIFRAAFSLDITENVTASYQLGIVEGSVFSAGNSDRDPLSGTTNINGTPFDPTDDTIENAFTLLPVGGFDYTSHELRLETTLDSGLYLMAGAFLMDGDDLDYVYGQGGIFEELYVGQDLVDSVTQAEYPLSEAALTSTNTEAQAAFARVSMPLMEDKLVLAAEGRYTDEDKLLNTGGVDYEYPDTHFTYRLSADYNLTDDQLIYVSAAKGIKSGGVNPDVGVELLDTERFYEPDENITYEIGSKNLFLDGRLQVNAAIYLIDWSNLQISTAAENATTGFTRNITTSLGAAESKGFEFDAVYAVTDALSLTATLALNDATYDEGTNSARLIRAAVCSDPDCTEGPTGDIGGNELPRNPDTQWSLGARYDGSISGFDYFLSADVAGQSEQFVGESNFATIPDRRLVNLSAGLENENWSAQLWVKNATDEEYVANAFYIPNPFFVDYVPTWGAKQRFGLTLDYNF